MKDQIGLLGVFVATLLAIMAGSAAAQFRIEDPDAGFELVFSPSWEPMETTELERINATVRSLTSQHQGPEVRYSHGAVLFVDERDPDAFVPRPRPVGYCLVQSTAAEFIGMSTKEAATVFKAEHIRDDAERWFSSAGIQAAMGQAFLNESADRLEIVSSTSSPDYGPMYGISYGFVGTHGIVFIHCYASVADFQTARVEFEALAGMFRWQLRGDTSSNRPGRSSNIKGGMWSRAMYQGLVGGGVAALLIVGIGVVSWVARRILGQTH